jgi:hypothetical protein
MSGQDKSDMFDLIAKQIEEKRQEKKKGKK